MRTYLMKCQQRGTTSTWRSRQQAHNASKSHKAKNGCSNLSVVFVKEKK